MVEKLEIGWGYGTSVAKDARNKQNQPSVKMNEKQEEKTKRNVPDIEIPCRAEARSQMEATKYWILLHHYSKRQFQAERVDTHLPVHLRPALYS